MAHGFKKYNDIIETALNMKKIIYWFRKDLRINYNPALFKASNRGEILPIYILYDKNPGQYDIGSASSWWLHNSFISLNQSLKGNLLMYRGDPCEILLKLAKNNSAHKIFWNRS